MRRAHKEGCVCLLGPLLTQLSTLPLQVLLRICGSNRERGTVHAPPQGLISSWTHLQQWQQQGIPMPRQDGTCC